MKKAIVTGANGFIGRNLVTELLKRGYFVYAVIRNKYEDIKCFDGLKNIVIIYCELDNINNLETLINNKEEINLFYHLAWNGVSTTYKNDFDIQFSNVRYTTESIAVADKLNCKKFISTGSLSECAYADKPVDGSEVPSPSDFYSCAKISARYFCMLYSEKHDIDINWCLVTSLYGPGRTDNNILTYTILSLLDGKNTEYTKLEQIWDYTYIDDLINALILIGEKGKNKEIYAIGSGETRKLKEYIQIIFNILAPNKELRVGQISYKTNRIDNSVANIAKLKKDTGYSANTSFKTGILKTIDYLKKTKVGNQL